MKEFKNINLNNIDIDIKIRIITKISLVYDKIIDILVDNLKKSNRVVTRKLGRLCCSINNRNLKKRGEKNVWLPV